MRNHSIYEDTNPHPIREMLDQIDRGQMALPEFQRDFVWEAGATQELIVSVANNFPAGSLLRLRLQNAASVMFQPRNFQGAPALSGNNLSFLVLDGQQRLTSLYSAFYGVGDYRYFLNMNALIAGEEFSDSLFFEKVGSKREIALRQNNVQAQLQIFPLASLWGGGGFLDWMINVVGMGDTSLLNDLRGIHEEWIKPIENYRFPVVTLSDSSSVDAVCTIFETLNRTGKKLTTFDLLTARFWPKGVKLRELWDDAQMHYPLLDEYEIEPYYLLQVVALLSRSAPSCKNSDVLNLEGNHISTFWNDGVKGMDEALNMLRDDCGILTAKWIPYATMLVTFAALCAKTSSIGPAMLGRREKLKRWFWCAVFNQVYEKAANSQVAKDFNEVLAWLNGGVEPDSVKNFVWISKTLRTVTPRQSGLYRGTMALIISQNTVDFHFGHNLTAAIIRADKIDDHHVFPRGYLKKKGTTDKSVDCILNRTLIDAQTNRVISDKAPSVYLGQIAIGAGVALDVALDSHLLPIGNDSPLRTDKFVEFLNWRETKLEILIAQRTS
jgi:hypothetical protein